MTNAPFMQLRNGHHILHADMAAANLSVVARDADVMWAANMAYNQAAIPTVMSAKKGCKRSFT